MVVETLQRDDNVELTSAFSILERIVVVETGPTKRCIFIGFNFQYPRTDRGG